MQIKRFLVVLLLCCSLLILIGCEKEAEPPREITAEELYQRSVLMCEALDEAAGSHITSYTDPILGDTYTEFDLYNNAYTTLHDLGDYKDSQEYFSRFSNEPYTFLYLMDGYGLDEPRRNQKMLLSAGYSDYCEINAFYVSSEPTLPWFLRTFYGLESISDVDYTGSITFIRNEESLNWRRKSPDSEYSYAFTSMLSGNNVVYASEITENGDWNDATYQYLENMQIKKYTLGDVSYSETTLYEDDKIQSSTLESSLETIKTAYTYDEEGRMDCVAIDDGTMVTKYYCHYQGDKVMTITKMVRNSEDNSLAQLHHYSLYYGEVIGYHNDATSPQ